MPVLPIAGNIRVMPKIWFVSVVIVPMITNGGRVRRVRAPCWPAGNDSNSRGLWHGSRTHTTIIYGRVMKRATVWITVFLVATSGLPGCFSGKRDRHVASNAELAHYKEQALDIEYPDVESADCGELASTRSPHTVDSQLPDEFWDMTLEEAIQLAMANSKVLRDLGGLVVTSPQNVRTIHDPAIVDTDPRFGVEGALSAFDAQWSTSVFFENNDRALNNQFFGGGTRELAQDLMDYTSELSKRTATGGDFIARHNAIYDFNNAPGNDDPNKPWTTNLELEFRQPILQGAGVEFNRIAGPDSAPGVYNGVLIARINTDVALADFEMGVRNLVYDVETAYWELYFAYRDLHAKIAARDRALDTWRRIKAIGLGVSGDKEAHAREQYYRLEEEVQNALSGRRQERTRVTTFRGTAGVYENERRLRLLIGVELAGDRLIRPSKDPSMPKVIFDWHDILAESLTRRSELRRQKWRIKRRELEVVAAKNFLRPRLDTIGRYRWRGLGENFLDNQGFGKNRFDNAVDDLLSGDFQEWQLGFELSFPVGYRRAHAGLRNAELLLAREHAILKEQEREVTHDLMNSVAEKDRAYKSAQLNYNRWKAAKKRLELLQVRFDELTAGDPEDRTQTRMLDLLLDAQRRLAESESRYFRAVAEYKLAIKQVHYNKGSLLDYNEIYLAEGPWPHKAYHDAADREKLRMNHGKLTNFIINKPTPVSQGEYPQLIGEGGYDSVDANPNPSGFDHQPETIEAPSTVEESSLVPIRAAHFEEPQDNSAATQPDQRQADLNFNPAGFDRITDSAATRQASSAPVKQPVVRPASAIAPADANPNRAGFDAPRSRDGVVHAAREADASTTQRALDWTPSERVRPPYSSKKIRPLEFFKSLAP